MSVIAWLVNQYKTNGTKYLGMAQGIVATLCGVAGLIPESHLKYWLAASALLTFFRGFENSKVTP